MAGGSGSTRSPQATAAATATDGNAYQVLAAAINAQLELIYHTSFALVQFPSQGNFPWYYRNGDLVFNDRTFGYISARVGPGEKDGLTQLSGPGSYPNAYAELLDHIEYYVNAADVGASDGDVLAHAERGKQVLESLRKSTSQPTESNGGMLTVDPVTGAIPPNRQVGYGINTPLDTIQQSLQSGQPTLTVRVPAGAGMTATISYPGYQLVAIQPTAWQQATNAGWYNIDPFVQAWKNRQKDVTGYRFKDPPSDIILGPLNSGGNFGRLVSLLISNTPIVSVGPAKSSAFSSSFVNDAAEKFYASLNLLNLRPPEVRLASGNAAVPQLQQSAYVVGAALDFVS